MDTSPTAVGIDTSPTAVGIDTAPTAEELLAARDLARRFVNAYEPDLYSGEDAAELVVAFRDFERIGVAGKLLSARRVEHTGHHQRQGHKQAGSWLAGISGEPVGQAASKMDSLRSMEAHPEVKEAFKQGKISEPQAKQIASAADRCPKEARKLVKEAPLLTYSELKRRCDDVRSASDSAEDEIERYERIRKSRYCRTWTDSDGAGHLEAKMTPDALSIITAAVGNFEKGIFENAHRSGVTESHQAYMMDALVAMARASGSGFPSDRDGTPESGAEDSGTGESGDDHKSRQTNDLTALLRLTVDLEAFLRGHATDGETCKIPGYGPVPVAAARKLLGEALLELVIKRGTDVTTVVSDSRYVRKALRIALEERDPTCVVPACDRSDPLERDHWQVDFGKDGPTSLDNLARLCVFHHHQKTYNGYVLDGGPGQWRFYKPNRAAGATSAQADAAADVAGADAESGVPDTPGAREAKRRATPANDPPVQPPLL